MELPSQFQIDEHVVFLNQAARIIKVSFTTSKVLYDLEVWPRATDCTRIYQVDSAFVTKT